MSVTTIEQESEEVTDEPLWTPSGADPTPAPEPQEDEDRLDDGPPAPPVADEGDRDKGREPVDVTTAFVVFQTLDGSWGTAPDLSIPFRLQRPPGNYDLTAGASCVLRDVAASHTAAHVVQAQMALVAQQAEASASEAILRQAGLGGGPAANRAGRRHPFN